MSSSTFKILFYVRKNYVNKNGKTGIMIRITLNPVLTAYPNLSASSTASTFW